MPHAVPPRHAQATMDHTPRRLTLVDNAGLQGGAVLVAVPPDTAATLGEAIAAAVGASAASERRPTERPSDRRPNAAGVTSAFNLACVTGRGRAGWRTCAVQRAGKNARLCVRLLPVGGVPART